MSRSLVFLRIIINFLFPTAFAKSVVGTVDKFNVEISKIGLAVGVGSLIFSAIKVSMGRKEAALGVALSILGMAIILGRQAIYNLLSSLV